MQVGVDLCHLSQYYVPNYNDTFYYIVLFIVIFADAEARRRKLCRKRVVVKVSDHSCAGKEVCCTGYVIQILCMRKVVRSDGKCMN